VEIPLEIKVLGNGMISFATTLQLFKREDRKCPDTIERVL